jgi:hypothetical protein
MKPRTLMCITTRTLIALLAIAVVPATQEQTEKKKESPRYTVTTKLERDQSEAINNKEGWEDTDTSVVVDDLVIRHTGGYCRIKSPQNIMDGFCAGSASTGRVILCVRRSDPAQCPVGKLAKSPGLVHSCLGDSTHVDISTQCQACIPPGGACYGPGPNVCCPAPWPHHSFCSNPTGWGSCIES